MRLAYSGLIFRKVRRYDRLILIIWIILLIKVLRLSSHAMNNLSTGQITNLLANDANKIEVAHFFFNFLWVCYKFWNYAIKVVVVLFFSLLHFNLLWLFCYSGILLNMSHFWLLVIHFFFFFYNHYSVVYLCAYGLFPYLCFNIIMFYDF